MSLLLIFPGDRLFVEHLKASYSQLSDGEKCDLLYRLENIELILGFLLISFKPDPRQKTRETHIPTHE